MTPRSSFRHNGRCFVLCSIPLALRKFPISSSVEFVTSSSSASCKGDSGDRRPRFGFPAPGILWPRRASPPPNHVAVSAFRPSGLPAPAPGQWARAPAAKEGLLSGEYWIPREKQI